MCLRQCFKDAMIWRCKDKIYKTLKVTPQLCGGMIKLYVRHLSAPAKPDFFKFILPSSIDPLILKTTDIIFIVD